MKCPTCGYDSIPETGRNCPNCGQSLPVSRDPTTHIEVTQTVQEIGRQGQVTGIDIRQLIGNVFISSPDIEHARDRHNQLNLLDKVRSFWIEGVLEQSVHHTLLIDLGKVVAPEAIYHPWSMTIQTPVVSHQPVPPNTPILTLFEEAGRALLILGAPGSGKTITLLELARASMQSVEQGNDQPVPVIFHLSSWSNHRLPLADWLVEEMNNKYQIPRPIGHQWVEKDALIYLLDGLDEVDARNRQECIQAINQFRSEHGLAGIVVASRIQEYENLKERLRLEGAIRLESLTVGQIDDTLAELGPSLSGLRTALRDDPGLRELAQTPLMFSILCLAYQGKPFESIGREPGADIRLRTRELLKSYVQQMFERRSGSQPYSPDQTIRWLGWLAREMKRSSQSQFLVESIQPGWLESGFQRRFYALAVILIAGLPIGVLLGFGVGYPVMMSGVLTTGIQLWWSVTLASMVMIALIVRRSFGLLGALLSGLVFGFAFGLPFGGYYGRVVGLSIGVPVSLIVGLAYLLVGNLLSRRTAAGGDEVILIDKLSWSWRRFAPGFLVGILSGSAFGAAFWWVLRSNDFIFRGNDFTPGFGLQFILIIGVSAGAIGGVLLGFTVRGVEMTIRPNQGIWRSAQNALKIGLVTWFVVSLPLVILTVSTWRLLYQENEIAIGLSTFLGVGLAFGLATSLFFGSLAFIQHAILRLLLASSGKIPWNFVYFLDYAAERIFLQKVGGGYIFIHRLVQEYFADVYTITIS